MRFDGLVSLSVIGVLLLASGCARLAELSESTERTGVYGSVFAPDFAARQPRAETSGSYGQQQQQELVAAGAFYAPATTNAPTLPPGVSASSDGEVNLNFEEADIADVAEAILGDALGVGYTLDPGVSGEVTLSTARPVPRDDLLAILETVLASNDLALVKAGELYRITGDTSSTALAVDKGQVSAGHGLSVIPLKYVSAQTLTRLIDGFAIRPGSVRVEKTRNLLIVAGSGEARRTAVETALSFDTDWMEDQSVAILPLRATKPETIIPELTRVFGSGSGESSEDVIQFMAMPRLRAILAVSQSRGLVERAQTWVARLDKENPDLDSNVHVYRVKYRDAQKLSELLGRLFSASGGGSAAPSGEATPPEEADPSALVDAAFSAPQASAATSLFLSDPGEALAGTTALRIEPDLSNNSLVIYGDRAIRGKVLQALAHIDVPQMQVAVNITMAEVRLNDQLRYGVQYFIKSGDIGLGRDDGSVGLFRTIADGIARELPGFNFVVGSENAPDVVLNALDAVTDVRVLSSPSLVVMENEVAKFRVGDQIPIVTRTVSSVEDANAPVSNEVEYRDTGIIMNVRPRIAENGVVTMVIEQEISSVSANASSLTPVISNRSVSSTISVVDGQTVLLGGLISEQSDVGRDGIPGLNQVEVVGNLFGSRSRADVRTELLILIRPSVIRDGRDAQNVAESLRAQMWNVGGGSMK
ncbi:type II secretion system secretin GspD [Aurantimonas sp. HBX-1]|uniref:type II secretion system secretin GspD n=1 Tax=Aurantimonas sp. HBX-1 TaxID=2906072 RepID=UPI001F296881|nr:type II secretion system secretin GspD [Aurantimonas sp. HBX-1]UIJ73890.1 type II secretion system secretin GspD [Aurantimonas sp. HBX-1]